MLKLNKNNLLKRTAAGLLGVLIGLSPGLVTEIFAQKNSDEYKSVVHLSSPRIKSQKEELLDQLSNKWHEFFIVGMMAFEKDHRCKNFYYDALDNLKKFSSYNNTCYAFYMAEVCATNITDIPYEHFSPCFRSRNLILLIQIKAFVDAWKEGETAYHEINKINDIDFFTNLISLIDEYTNTLNNITNTAE